MVGELNVTYNSEAAETRESSVLQCSCVKTDQDGRTKAHTT